MSWKIVFISLWRYLICIGQYFETNCLQSLAFFVDFVMWYIYFTCFIFILPSKKFLQAQFLFTCWYKLMSFRHSIHWHLSNTTPFLLKQIQYIPRNMHMLYKLSFFVAVHYCLIYKYYSRLIHWNRDNGTIAPVPLKQPWRELVNKSHKSAWNYNIITRHQITTKSC